jgi:predicted ATPase/class 3 adenylate cyclase
MRTDLPQGTVTLLLTDIEGSTRLLHRLGAAAYADVLAAHRALLRRAFADHRGAEVDTQGDAFFVAFPSTTGALRAAMQSQRALAGAAWPAGVDVKVRMGLHCGTPQRTDEGYVGMDVHAAARVASCGHGGQVLLSARTAERLAEEDPQADILLRDLGEFRLKDLDGPQRLLQVVFPDLPSDFPPPRSLSTRPNNLPAASTPFIGRASLVADLRDLVLRPDVRLVTLTGPGGTGKSRLGLRVATELLSRFADGVYFVPLVAVRDPTLVLSAIAASVGVREESDRPIAQALVDALANKEILLLIDNFEQVQSAARDVGTLLARCPRLKIVVTSREALRLTGSRAYAVPPLGLPSPGRLPPLAELARNEAVSLFVERARSIRGDFALDETNAEDIVAICRQIDALPLAIELAAARTRTMNPDRLRRALDRRLKVLTTGGDDLLDHQRTLRDLIAWSYELLAPGERSLWCRLAIFSGGCTMQAAQAVCDLDGDVDVELDCESLVAKSLLTLDFGSARSGVEKVIQGEAEGPRLLMLETLREFAVEQLAGSGEVDALERRHRDWYVALAEEAEPNLRGPAHPRWMTRLDAESANFRIALERSLDAGAVDAALRLGAALWFFWYQSGLLHEGRQWLERALDAAEAADDADPRLRARALLGAASIARQQNLPDDAERRCEEAATLYRALGDREGLAIALGELGAILQRRGDLDRAAAFLAEALEGLRQTPNRERVSFTLIALGVVEHLRGDLDAAAGCYEEGLAIGRALGDQNAIATALVNLGEVQQQRGDNVAGAGYYRESLGIYARLGLRNAIAYCLEILAGIDAVAGRMREAALEFGAAERIREEIGAPVESFNLDRVHRDLARVRDSMDADTFHDLWQQGRDLRLDEAIELAMRDNADSESRTAA